MQRLAHTIIGESIVADFDAVTYLASKGKHGRQANGPEVVYACFMDCGLPDDSRKKKWYLNTEEGFYSCKVCGVAGGSTLLQRFFGDDPGKLEIGPDPHIRRRILNWAAEVGSVMLSNNDEIMLYLLNERGLSAQTIIDRKIGFVGNRWSLVGSLPEDFNREDLASTGLTFRDGPRAGHDFFYNHITIPYTSRGNVVQIRGKVLGGKYVTGPGDPARIFDQDALDGAEDVVITEGEFDAMALSQALSTASDDRARKIAVVGLPGAGVFKDDFLRYFSNARRVYIGLDPDATGKREAVKIKDALGTRARILELPSELPKCDWTDYLLPAPSDASTAWKDAHPHHGHGWRDVMRLFGTAAGKRVFSMADAGASYRALREQGDGLETGFVKLDGVLHPGLREGQVLVFLAKTGAGKTIMLCNLAYNMRRKRVLFISLEQTREEVYERMRRIAHFYNPRWSDAQIEDEMGNIYICDENKIGDKDLGQLIEETTVEGGGKPDVLIVDYLQYFARGVPGQSQYERVTNASMALKEIAKKYRLVLISPSQVNRVAKQGQPIDLDDARDSGAIEETADFLLSLWRPDETSEALNNENVYRTGKVKISVLKSRHGGKGTTVSLVMDMLTLVIVDEHTPNSRRAELHNQAFWTKSTTYEQLRAYETAPFQPDLDEGTRYGRDR